MIAIKLAELPIFRWILEDVSREIVSRVVWRGSMSGLILNPVVASIGAVTTLLAWGAVFGVPDTASADNCLTEPNSSAPQGSHWYYRTDRANQRKCWYFRAPGEQAQQGTAQAIAEAAPAAQSDGRLSTDSSAGAPMSINPSDITPPSPHTKMLAVEPKPVSTRRDKLVQGRPQKESTATSDEPASNLPAAWPESPPAIGTSQEEIAVPTDARANSAGVSTDSVGAPISTNPSDISQKESTARSDERASNFPAAWPESPPAIGTSQKEIAVPTDTRANSAGIREDILASNHAENTAGSGEPTTNIGIAGYLSATPQMFLIIALGLAAVGILSRILMTIIAGRRSGAVFNHPDPHWVDDQSQDEGRDDQDEYGSVEEREADYAPISTARHYGPPWHQTDGGFSDDSGDLNEVSKRDDTLARLRQDLDRLLQSAGAGQPLPSRHDEQNANAHSFGPSGETQGEALRKALGLV
jgi:hypothetical protein